jgi:hypothetical protein
VKEKSENIFAGLGCLSIVIVAGYAFFKGRLLELVIIYLAFFALLKLVDYTIISKLSQKTQERLKGFFNKNTALTIVLIFSTIFGTFFFGSRIIDGFTSVETLTTRIHERSKYKFSGSKCNDGWTSFSQGQGACSWHNGVDYEFYKGEYSRTIEECRQEAEELSWLDH